MAMQRLELKFYKLAQQWKEETGAMSLIFHKVKHPAYQEIISMGWPIVPLILRDLEREPNHWFWALRVITGTNPVKPEHQGKPKEMARDWIEWGKKCNS